MEDRPLRRKEDDPRLQGQAAPGRRPLRRKEDDPRLQGQAAPGRRRLIVTADDFGSTPWVNRAVERSFRDGILRFASLMVQGKAAQDAVRLAHRLPGLGVGVHLDLCRRDPARWGLEHFLRRGLARKLEDEIERQIQRCLSWNLRPTHLDSHLNVHIHPTVFPMVVAAARRHGIPRVRLTGGELTLRVRYGGAGLVPAVALGTVFGALRLFLRPKARGLVVPDRTLGLLRSGAMTEDYLLWLVPRLPEGLTELYFHPTADPGPGEDGGPDPRHHSRAETAALTSGRVKESLRRCGVRLVGDGEESG